MICAQRRSRGPEGGMMDDGGAEGGVPDRGSPSASLFFGLALRTDGPQSQPEKEGSNIYFGSVTQGTSKCRMQNEEWAVVPRPSKAFGSAR